jgi:glycosyltransferase involved in cell wall biosynthesis
VLDLVDVDSAKWDDLATASRGPMRWIYAREALLLRRFEIEASRAASATVVVSEKEAAALRTLDSNLRPVVVPNGVDADGYRNPGAASTSHGVVFTGVFNYRPNLDGARWLIDDVWPLVRRQVPDARLSLVGSGPGRGLRDKAARAGVVVTGSVPDVRPYLWASAVAVAPLHTARGVQNKVLEGVAAGLPAVVTPAVYDGLPAEARLACRMASSTGAFADAIVGLLVSREERARVVEAAAVDSLSWERCLAPLDALLHGAVGPRMPV